MDDGLTPEQRLQAAYHDLEMLEEDLKNARHRLAERNELIRCLYFAFRWDAWTEAQSDACQEAEGVLDLPKEQRRDWS